MKKQSCQSKVNHTCTGSIQYALCTSYEGILPEFSELECPSIEETTEELYNLVGEIKEETDLSELGEKCLEYLLDENDKLCFVLCDSAKKWVLNRDLSKSDNFKYCAMYNNSPIKTHEYLNGKYSFDDIITLMGLTKEDLEV